jgi:hypothetical protein
MGIRHQFWAIARVGDRYRSLGIVHCQNATGTDATRACWRLLKIFGSSANETLIRHDCNYALTKTEDWWKSITRLYEGGRLEDCFAFPFPFIHTCLVLGAAYDSRLDKPFPYFYPVSAYETGTTPLSLTFNNQSGFTIIDITDRNQLRYCFMFPPEPNLSMAGIEYEEDEDEEDEEDEAPRCRPLTAEEYLRCKYVEEHVLDVDLSQWDLITYDTLRELWPDVPWENQNDIAPCSQQTSYHREEATLKDLAFRRAIEEALDKRQTEEALDIVKCIPGFSLHLRQLLYESPDSVKRPCGVALLGAAIREARALDFSPFPWLEGETILQLVESNVDTQMVESIDLSCNSNISVATVEKLLRLCPNITTLNVVQASNLPLEALGKTLAEKGEVELCHSDLFRAALDVQDLKDKIRLAALPNHMASVETVRQIIFLSINKDIPNEHSLRLEGGGLKWSELTKARSDKTQFQREFERGRGFFSVTIPLHDTFLSPLRLDWFSRLLWFFATNGATNDVRWWRDGHTSMGCACALAMDVEVSIVSFYPHMTIPTNRSQVSLLIHPSVCISRNIPSRTLIPSAQLTYPHPRTTGA